MSYKIKEYARNGTFKGTEYPTMLDAVKANRVFEVERFEDGTLCIGECCDYHFSVDVTPDQLRALGQELIDLANVEISHAPPKAEST